mgnify:CR=1 FL=1
MIKIAHLYPELLNLYGEDGNLKAITYALSTLNIEYSITNLTINSKFDICNYDFIYIGAGTEENLKIVANDIKKYTDDLKKYIENNKILLSTGNSLDLFGQYIKLPNDEKISTLDIFNFSSIENEKRIVSEVMFKMGTIEPLIGFYNNKISINEATVKNYNPLFEIYKTIGIDKNEFKFNGVTKNNFYGTHILGPILARNPELLKFFIARIIEISDVKNENLNSSLDLHFEYLAREEFIKNYYDKKKKSKIR